MQLAPHRAQDYEHWYEVGAILHSAGCTVQDFHNFSRQSQTYDARAVEAKWAQYDNTKGRGLGSLVQWVLDDGGALPEGTSSKPGRALDWGDEVDISAPAIEAYPIPQPASANWIVDSIEKALHAMFRAEDVVGYVMASWEREKADGTVKHLPANKGAWRLCSDLLQDVRRYGDDIGATFGDYDAAAGAWLRVNPLDGQGVADANVADFRHVLVESDAIPIEEQWAIVQKMELPCSAVVHSGGKSVHAVVKIEAPDKRTYQDRVQFLFEQCKKQGLLVDGANKNPSRLMRLPGCMRGDKQQYVIATDIGKGSWAEWEAWQDELDDELPDFVRLSDVIDCLPPLKPELIKGILRKGHKLLLSGPSKAGKSWAMIQLATACATGGKWFDHEVAQGRVLYLNLELDTISGHHRFANVMAAQGHDSAWAHNITIWPLRGSVVPLHKLAPKLIRRAQGEGFDMIIFDPIYKITDGDENDAAAVTAFMNEFDALATKLDAAVICCHHHSKGAQGARKAIDRASGSGVWGRDPDARVDMIELEIDKARRTALADLHASDELRSYFDADWPDHGDHIPQDDYSQPDKLMAHVRTKAPEIEAAALRACAGARERVKKATGWRVEYVLREFVEPDITRCWFVYPTHEPDTAGLLEDAYAVGELPPQSSTRKKRAEVQAEDRKRQMHQLDLAVSACDLGGEERSVANVAAEAQVSEVTVRKWLQKSKNWKAVKGVIVDKED